MYVEHINIRIIVIGLHFSDTQTDIMIIILTFFNNEKLESRVV